MIKSYKYIYCYTDNKNRARETTELFIPVYHIAISVIDNKVTIVSADQPRTNKPFILTSFNNITEEEQRFLEKHVPQKFKNNPITEIEIFTKDAQSFLELYKLQVKLDNIKTQIYEKSKKY